MLQTGHSKLSQSSRYCQWIGRGSFSSSCSGTHYTPVPDSAWVIFHPNSEHHCLNALWRLAYARLLCDSQNLRCEFPKIGERNGHDSSSLCCQRRICKLRRCPIITYRSCLPCCPSSALQQELHNPAMRLLLRLKYEQHCCAISATYFWTTP